MERNQDVAKRFDETIDLLLPKDEQASFNLALHATPSKKTKDVYAPSPFPVIPPSSQIPFMHHRKTKSAPLIFESSYGNSSNIKHQTSNKKK